MRATVRGTVQGVGFRSFVLREARGLALTGYVANTSGGDVEVVAEGPRDRLDLLAARLRVGPRASRVAEVEIGWSDGPIGEFDGFDVRVL
jgi:acylphosphatase